MSTSDLYIVELSNFARKHYVKKFEKKYPPVAWNVTYRSICADLARIDEYLKYDKAETIHDNGKQRIVKVYFRVAQTKESAKASGNRLIALVNGETKIVKILLVYSKNEISPPNETAKWQTIVKQEFGDVAKLFNL